MSRKPIQMATVLKTPIEVGEWRLKTFEFEQERLKHIRLRALLNSASNPFAHLDGFIKPNYKYTQLLKGDTIWMSDTPLELYTNRAFISNAKGRVFVAGLGIGLVIVPLLDDPEIASIDVVEKEPDVIELFNKAAVDLDLSKLTIHQGDAFEPDQFLNGHKFDSLYFDIWSTIDSDNYPETKQLYKIYRKHIDYKAGDPYVDFWVRDHIRKEHLAYNGYY